MPSKNMFGSWSFPLSGDVTQAINPWSWWTSSMQQTGFININQMQSSNPQLEREILENVAGYGRQLGRIIEALCVVCEKGLDQSRLDEAERKAVKCFQGMAADIAALKTGYYEPTPMNVDKMIAGLRKLRSEDPDRYAQVMLRLNTELFAASPPLENKPSEPAAQVLSMPVAGA